MVGSSWEQGQGENSLVLVMGQLREVSSWVQEQEGNN